MTRWSLWENLVWTTRERKIITLLKHIYAYSEQKQPNYNDEVRRQRHNLIRKIFLYGEMLIRTLTTTFLQIFCKIILQMTISGGTLEVLMG